jgi:uncharacterized protein (DUF488 family)
MNTIYTIGYSGFTVDQFVAVLKRHKIQAIADVRSIPYSKLNDGFNRDGFSIILKKHGMDYVFLGDNCGARYTDPNCHADDGRVDFAKVAQRAFFLEGIQRILQGAKKMRIALMCAEKDPITCHRAILVCKSLKERTAKIEHILGDKSLESHSHLEGRLVRLYHLGHPDLFRTYSEILEEAYARQSRKIAYRPNGNSIGE